MSERPPEADRPRRVLLLSRPLRIGAYQRKAELIARDERFELTVAVPARWREHGVERPVERAHVTGYSLVALPVLLPGHYHLHAYRGLAALVDRLRPDLVHIDEEAYNVAAFQALRAVLAARDRGTARPDRQGRGGAGTRPDRPLPRALFFSWQNLRRRYPPPFSAFERAMFAHADGAIAGSRSAAGVLRAKGYSGPLWTIPQFGVDAARFHPPTVPRQRDAGRLRIGYAGRLVPEKGVAVLIEAVARLAHPLAATGASPEAPRSSDRPSAASGAAAAGASPITRGVPRPAVTLEIVGDGPEHEPLRRKAIELGIADTVRFAGALPSTEMPAFYQRIDALALPSRTTRAWTEQFGRVLIEAMACGAVCVGSDAGEIPHVLGPAGIVVSEGSAGALAEALRRLADDPDLRASMAEAGRARALDHFTMERVAEATTGAWAALLGMDGAAPAPGETLADRPSARYSAPAVRPQHARTRR